MSSVVLLSGGLDSSVNLYAAHKIEPVSLAVTFNYGQKAFQKETYTSQSLCKELGIPHKLIDVTWLGDVTKTSLVSNSMNIPTGNDVQIDDVSVSQKTAKAVWVPNRNGVFLNVGAALAEAMGIKKIVVGFNLEEAQTFPDNSKAYLDSLNHSFKYSTANHVEVTCYTIDMNKTEIVKLGHELKVPLKKLWPCYFSGENHCKVCESCQRYYRALKNQGVQIDL